LRAHRARGSSPLKVLIVDDEPFNLKVLRVRLEAEGVTVHEAADGMLALNTLDAGLEVDAVVSDVLMPNMDGYRLCYEVRQRERIHHLPFVFYSNTYSAPGDHRLAIEIGGDAFIPKPAGANLIVGVLREIMSRPDRPSLRSPIPQPLEAMKRYSELLVRKLEEQLDAARAALSEKEALLKEVHHRVKNNLQVISSLLRLEEARSSNPQTEAVLREMQARIQSMSLLHENLYRSGTFASTDLGRYLREVATQTFHALARAEPRVSLNLSLESVESGMDQAIPCGLILNELISNCLKHAFRDAKTGRIDVTLRRTNPNEAELRVADSGAGLPPDVDARMRGSLGLQLVSDLARQLGGRFSLGNDAGANLVVTFPSRDDSAESGQAGSR
jgi:two-component sensor histidine kinase/AmiR/NasT family two-component response regulator